MARALFFQEDYFFKSSAVDENTDYDLIQPVIWDCQELYIQDILGSPLYNALKDEIVTNGGTLTTAKYVTLVDDYVAPCLLNYTLMDAQVTMLYKMRNKSVLTDRSDYSDPVDFSEHKYLTDNYRIKAEQYAEKIERYLCANQSTYPLYTTYTSSDEVRAQNQRPTTSVWMGGVYKGGKGYGYEYYEKS